ncbi:protein kinase family protein [Wenjunlia tyrosinilytica]|uniref:Serine/threonine protein kinase n=1 Tax=Wenjunlia tyrosinilytica TaxID=1544741 RepID=A0A917ZMM3_9ACTN|nr:protein kinase family protein [Wenjunlia tyrosinilytica]GGO86240.1 serine/threonine protein kinase [Wenjunlia tyrosinilytica]
MADRSTAAVDVANESGAPLDGAADAAATPGATIDAVDKDETEAEPLQGRTGEDEVTTTADTSFDASAADASTAKASSTEATAVTEELPEVAASTGPLDLPKVCETLEEPKLPEPPELHSGHKLARRYRLEECVTRADGFSSWRAVDEMLRRAVGVHILPSDHLRAKRVLAAARSAALLGDPRFVQVLDAVEEDELVYVVHEWLPDATELTAVLAEGPMQPYEADHMVRQLAEAMAAAHREGLSHLKLTPHAVLRTEGGQFRIRGLAVAAALHGCEADRPQRVDTEAIGALLYAAITQRWPYSEDAHGLVGLPRDIGLVAPDQVRAGVHRGLSELAMRALVNDGATSTRQEPACATPEELAKAAAGMPRVRPPEPELGPYQRTTYQQGSYRQPPSRTPVTPAPSPVAPPPPPPALPGRTGKALKWAVSGLLIAALGLGSWQVADAFLHKDKHKSKGSTSSSGSTKTKTKPKTVPLGIQGAQEFVSKGSPQHPNDVAKTYDRDKTTYWRTSSYLAGPPLAPYKDGVGIIYDLGSAKDVTGVTASLQYPGNRTTGALYATDSLQGGPLSSMKKIGGGSTQNRTLKIQGGKAVRTRYVLLWLTELPHAPKDDFSNDGYKQGITDLSFAGLKK